jgi:hypothetical protein
MFTPFRRFFIKPHCEIFGGVHKKINLCNNTIPGTVPSTSPMFNHNTVWVVAKKIVSLRWQSWETPQSNSVENPE